MTLTEYLRVLRAQWWVVVLLAALALAGAAAYTYRQTPQYTAETRLFVKIDSSTDTSQLQSGNTLAQQKVKSYADIITSSNVLLPVIRQLQLPYSLSALQQKIKAETPLDTVLLEVSVTDPDPQLAAGIANQIATRFPEYVNTLEAQDGRTTSPVRITQTDPAVTPTAPVSPRVPLNLALGLLVGLGLGVGAAVLRDQMNTSVSGIGDLEHLTGSIPLGVVPYDGGASKHPLVQADESGGRAEAYRTLRTNLQFADVDNPPRVIVVTSALPDEGKSTSAANLAFTLALSGARVILVDGDLRKPALGSYLGVSNAAGLTNVLAGQRDLRDVLVSYQRNTMAVLPSGPTPPNPSELLGSRHMADLITTMANHYDIVVIDAPPLLPVTDATVLAASADGAVLVVRHGKTRREAVTRAVQSLAVVNAKLLGTVLNAAPRRRARRGYDGYGYGYGAHQPAAPEAAAESGWPRHNGRAPNGHVSPPLPSFEQTGFSEVPGTRRPRS